MNDFMENKFEKYIKIFLWGVFIFFIIYIFLAIVLVGLKFYTGKYAKVESTITNIEQYSYEELQKNYVGLKIEFSYIVDGKEYKYEYKGPLTDKIYSVGDTQIVYYSIDNPGDIMLNKHYLIIEGILILIPIFFYFIYIRKNKKSTFQYFIFVVFAFGTLYSANNIISQLKTRNNYEKVVATVDNAYTYYVEGNCKDDYSNKCGYKKIGALYYYEVDHNLYKASQLDVSSKTKYGDTKTIYYSQKNPMYYSFSEGKDLIFDIFVLFLCAIITIIANPFSKDSK